MSMDAGQHGGAPSPGWYADPEGNGHRWWDGQRWTEHLQPAAPAHAQVATMVHPPSPAISPGTPDGFAPIGGTSGGGRFGTTSVTDASSAQGQFGASDPYATKDQPEASGPYGGPGQYGATSPYGGPGQYGATSSYGPASSYGPTSQYGSPAVFAPKPPVKNTAATVSMVFGIVSLTLGLLFGIYFASFLALFLGSKGLQRAKELSAEGYGPVGRARSIWGLVLSGICFVVVIILKSTAP